MYMDLSSIPTWSVVSTVAGIVPSAPLGASCPGISTLKKKKKNKKEVEKTEKG